MTLSLHLENANILYATNVPLSSFSTMGVGGNAEYMVFPRTLAEMECIHQLVKYFEVPFRVLGKGANILVSDQGCKGIVIHTKYLQKIEIFDNYITAECGVALGKLLKVAADYELSGLERLCGITATVGGAVTMNAGAMYFEIENSIDSVFYLPKKETRFLWIRQHDFAFGYRHSLSLADRGIVGAVKFHFTHRPRFAALQEMKAIAKTRKNKQPLQYKNAGSIFKRTDHCIPAKIIDELGLKGLRIGDAAVSTKHSGFIINLGSATFKDVISLIQMIEFKVKEAYGIELQREVDIWCD